MTAPRLILDLQTASASPHSKSEQELRQLAEDYAAACEDVARRLARCVSYLRRGFRSEAIRLSEMEPNLLDHLNELIFPGRDTWVRIAEHLGITTRELPQELAVELNEAYEAYEATKDMAAEFRLLNIMRRPAEERRAALNALIAADPYHTTWQENLSKLNQE